MPKFRINNERKRVHSRAGYIDKLLYQPKINKQGILDLVESGKENLYDYIQSFRDEVNIPLLVQKFINGDVNALNRKQAMFLDVTKMPKTYAEMFSLVQSGIAMFEDLPLDVKKAYEQNPYLFFEDMGSDNWYNVLGLDKPVIKKPGRPKKEVVDAAPVLDDQMKEKEVITNES